MCVYTKNTHITDAHTCVSTHETHTSETHIHVCLYTETDHRHTYLDIFCNAERLESACSGLSRKPRFDRYGARRYPLRCEA